MKNTKLSTNPPKLVTVVGPTASGKSDLAVRLARRFDGEILSADSRQVYKGLNIGTGKITKKEMRGIPHHLLDVASPKRRFSAADFKKHGEKALTRIIAEGKLPIIAGGTGFYIDALLGASPLPDVPPDAALRKRLARKSASELFGMLKKLDPRRARIIDRNNPVRLIRAIEIATVLGAVPKAKKEAPRFNVLKIGLRTDMETLTKKISRRLRARLAGGMLAEAKRLHRSGLSFKRMEELGLEYRYMARHLSGRIRKEEMLRELDIDIRNYAKRQNTWFKRDSEIEWIDAGNAKAAERLVRAFLDDKR